MSDLLTNWKDKSLIYTNNRIAFYKELDFLATPEYTIYCHNVLSTLHARFIQDEWSQFGNASHTNYIGELLANGNLVTSLPNVPFDQAIQLLTGHTQNTSTHAITVMDDTPLKVLIRESSPAEIANNFNGNTQDDVLHALLYEEYFHALSLQAQAGINKASSHGHLQMYVYEKFDPHNKKYIKEHFNEGGAKFFTQMYFKKILHKEMPIGIFDSWHQAQITIFKKFCDELKKDLPSDEWGIRFFLGGVDYQNDHELLYYTPLALNAAYLKS